MTIKQTLTFLEFNNFVIHFHLTNGRDIIVQNCFENISAQLWKYSEQLELVNKRFGVNFLDIHWRVPQENSAGYIEKVSTTTDNFVLGTVTNPTSNAVSLEERDSKLSYDILIYNIESSYEKYVYEVEGFIMNILIQNTS